MSNAQGCQCGQAHGSCTEFQYAVKLVGGQANVPTSPFPPFPPVAVGKYWTATNLHNPDKCKTAHFRVKLAVANSAPGRPRFGVSRAVRSGTGRGVRNQLRRYHLFMVAILPRAIGANFRQGLPCDRERHRTRCGRRLHGGGGGQPTAHDLSDGACATTLHSALRRLRPAASHRCCGLADGRPDCCGTTRTCCQPGDKPSLDGSTPIRGSMGQPKRHRWRRCSFTQRTHHALL